MEIERANLVFESVDGHAITNSLIVAERFGKQHYNVLRDIENKQKSRQEAGLGELNFECSNYLSKQGKAMPMYLMDREAFWHLSMGFTGVEAEVWKDRFFKAFEELESKAISALAVLSNTAQAIEAITNGLGKATMQIATVSNTVDQHSEILASHDDRIVALENRRAPFSNLNKSLYRLCVVRFYQGMCPCCGEVRIVDKHGNLISGTGVYEHANDRNRNWLSDGWLVCVDCNSKQLERRRHQHRLEFDLFHKRLDAMQGMREQIPLL